MRVNGGWEISTDSKQVVTPPVLKYPQLNRGIRSGGLPGNSTLRLSAGHVEGYQPADAVTHDPVTTLGGLIDKHEEAVLLGDDDTGPGVFDCPPRLVSSYPPPL